MRNFKALVKMANKEIAKVEELLQSKAECFATRNLKLYDIVYHSDLQEEFELSCEQYNMAFEWFCHDSYRMFEEWMDFEGVDGGTMQYIGRTSSFNLIPTNGIVEIDRYDEVDIETSICEYINNFIGCSNLDIVIDERGRISLEKIRKYLSSLGNEFYCLTVEEAIDSLKNDIERLTEDILQTYEYSLQDTVKIHEYLKGFQDNQVEYFSEYLEFYVDEYTA